MHKLSNVFLILVITLFPMLLPAINAPTTMNVSLTKIVDTKIIMPGEFEFFSNFNAPYYYQDSIVFEAGINKKNRGVFTNAYGAISLVANISTILPGNKKPIFRKFDQADFPVLVNGNILFSADDNNANSSVYHFSDNKISTIANQSTIVPGGARGLFSDCFSPNFYNKNNIAFIGNGTNDTGIYYVDSDRTVSVLVDNHTKIPGIDDTFSYFNAVSFPRYLDTNSRFVFIGKGSKSSNIGIFLYDHGKILTIANQLTEIPNGIGNFNDFDSPSYDAQTNQIAFVGHGILSQSGIYLYNGKKIIKATDQLDVIPKGIDKFNQFYTPTVQNGIISFRGIGYNGVKGIYIYFADKLYSVASINDKIDGKITKEFELSSNSFDDGKVAFAVHFNDDSQGIYTAQLSFSKY